MTDSIYRTTDNYRLRLDKQLQIITNSDSINLVLQIITETREGTVVNYFKKIFITILFRLRPGIQDIYNVWDSGDLE
jgi:hypothetical protein